MPSSPRLQRVPFVLGVLTCAGDWHRATEFFLGILALLLGRILFRWRTHKSIKTLKTLVLFLYKAAISHRLGTRGSLLWLRRYLLIVAVQPFLALIFNFKAGPQCL